MVSIQLLEITSSAHSWFEGPCTSILSNEQKITMCADSVKTFQSKCPETPSPGKNKRQLCKLIANKIRAVIKIKCVKRKDKKKEIVLSSTHMLPPLICISTRSSKHEKVVLTNGLVHTFGANRRKPPNPISRWWYQVPRVLIRSPYLSLQLRNWKYLKSEIWSIDLYA